MSYIFSKFDYTENNACPSLSNINGIYSSSCSFKFFSPKLRILKPQTYEEIHFIIFVFLKYFIGFLFHDKKVPIQQSQPLLNKTCKANEDNDPLIKT